MLRIASLPVLATLAACAASPLMRPDLVLAEPPPSFDRIEAEMESARCSNLHRQYEIRGEREPDTDFAPLETRCFPQMPRFMINLGIQASCMSMFDLDAEGAPMNRVTRCDIGHAYYKLSDEWRDYADRAFKLSLDRMYAQTRYAPAASRPASERRTNISSGANFGIDGDRFVVEMPRPFQREGAPPLPESLLKLEETER